MILHKIVILITTKIVTSYMLSLTSKLMNLKNGYQSFSIINEAFVFICVPPTKEASPIADAEV